MRCRTAIFPALVVAAVAALAVADDPTAPAVPAAPGSPVPSPVDPSVEAVQVDGLAGQLGSDDYAVREAAEAQLTERGAGVTLHLDRTLARSDDAEVLIRLERVYRKLVPSQAYAGTSLRPGFLGVQMKVVSTDEEPRLKGRQWGVQVEGVVADGPAEKAGMRNGDLIVLVDGQPFVGDVTQMSFIRRVQRVGDGGSVEIEFLRGAERRKVTVKLTAIPGAADAPDGAPVPGRAQGAVIRGVVIVNGQAVLSGPSDQVTAQDVVDYRWDCWWQAHRREVRAGVKQGGPSSPPATAPADAAKPVPEKPAENDATPKGDSKERL